jgi:predicted transcriptional regulator
VPEEEVAQLAGSAPNAARAVLALYRAWRVAREDSGGIALPTGRRILLPTEEVRDFFHDRANHFAELETVAEAMGREIGAGPAELNFAIAERLRRHHGVAVTFGPLPGVLRRYDPAGRRLDLSDSLPRQSRGFQLAFQLVLMEARDAVEAVVNAAEPSTGEAGMMLRIGLLNYLAAALLMPYEPFLAAVRELRHDMESVATRFGVSFEQACHRLSTLQRDGARGVPFFFLRVDPAGNVGKRFSAASFPFARYGGSCPKWIVHQAFATPGQVRVQLAQLPDGGTFLCFARTVRGPGRALGRAGPGPRDRHGLRHLPRAGGGLRRRPGPGKGDGRHRPVLPAVRPARLPQPRLPAAGAPLDARPHGGRHVALPLRAAQGPLTRRSLPPLQWCGGARRVQIRGAGGAAAV